MPPFYKLSSASLAASISDAFLLFPSPSQIFSLFTNISEVKLDKSDNVDNSLNIDSIRN
jgi:hypothetical protein